MLKNLNKITLNFDFHYKQLTKKDQTIWLFLYNKLFNFLHISYLKIFIF